MEYSEFYRIMAEGSYEIIENRELYEGGINVLYKKLNRDDLKKEEAENISEAFHAGFAFGESREKRALYLDDPFLRYG